MSLAKGLIAGAALIGGAMAQVEVLGAICERETAYVNPILIEVTVPSPTVLDIYGEVQLTVTQAPTSISTLTYGTRTETETYIYEYTTTFGTVGTATSAVATALPTAGSFDTPFALAFVGAATKHKAKRGDASKRDILPGVDLVGGAGFSDNCADASSFYLKNGSLWRNGYKLSTSGDASYQELDPVIPALEVVEYFAIADAVLSWVNNDFTDTDTVFCSLEEIIYAVFDEAGAPANCGSGTLYGIPGANCPGFTPIYPVSTASSTASSASGTATNSANMTMTGSSSSTVTASSNMTMSMTGSSASSSATGISNSTISATSVSSSVTSVSLNSTISATSASSTDSSSTSSSTDSSSSTDTASSTASSTTSTDTASSTASSTSSTDTASSTSSTSTDTSSSTSSATTTSSTFSTSTSTSSTSTASTSAAAGMIKEREADMDDMVLRRRRSKFNTRGKLVHGGFAQARDAEAELAADEDQ